VTEPDDLERIRKDAMSEFKSVLEELKADYPQAVEGAAAAVGSALGAGASYTALFFAGTTGLSAAGITSGLATAGALVGGGMVAGIGVLAAPIVVPGIVGYALVKRRRNARLAAALRTAIDKLYGIQKRLAANAEYFRNELAEIKAYVDHLERQMP